jgi:hypothetical protein
MLDTTVYSYLGVLISSRLFNQILKFLQEEVLAIV